MEERLAGRFRHVPAMTSEVMAVMTSPGELGSTLEPLMFLQPSRTRLVILLCLYAVHTAITLVALTHFSLIGLLQQAALNWGTAQIFSDLTFALVLVSVWLTADARRRGVAAAPWLLGTLVFGSLSPGLYLIVREVALTRAPPSAPPAVV